MIFLFLSIAIIDIKKFTEVYIKVNVSLELVELEVWISETKSLSFIYKQIFCLQLFTQLIVFRHLNAFQVEFS